MLLIVTNERSHDAINNLTKLYESFRSKNIPFMITKKCDPDIIKRKDIRGIIIPGGHMRISLDSIQKKLDLELYYLFHFPELPVLGICHGCQLLMVYYGGSLLQYDTYYKGNMPTKIDVSIHTLFEGCKPTQDMHFYFHDLPVVKIPENKEMKEISWFTFRDNKYRACAFEIKKDRIYGLMYHPEANEESRIILYNFYYNVCGGGSGGGSAGGSAPLRRIGGGGVGSAGGSAGGSAPLRRTHGGGSAPLRRIGGGGSAPLRRIGGGAATAIDLDSNLHI